MQRLTRTSPSQISETRGKSLTAFDRQITPIGQAVQVHWPGGGFTWHRPVAVEVRQGEAMHRLPIRNATSRTTTMIVLIGVAITVLVSSLIRRRRKS